MPIGLIAFAVAVAYLLGSIPTGVLIARAHGKDITKLGSGNIGATNVARSLGKKSGVIVLLFDLTKGLAPTLTCKLLWPGEHHLIAGVALATVLGHVFPISLRLRGGKGVATAFGAFLAISLFASGVALLCFAIVYAVKRIASLGSLTAATSIPITLFVRGEPLVFVALGIAVWLLILIRHRGNIRRLMRKEELGL